MGFAIDADTLPTHLGLAFLPGLRGAVDLEEDADQGQR